jgi:hypothetical protein
MVTTRKGSAATDKDAPRTQTTPPSGGEVGVRRIREADEADVIKLVRSGCVRSACVLVQGNFANSRPSPCTSFSMHAYTGVS